MSLHGRASAPESAFSCDLHCHSVYSDGKDTYAQLMRLAEAVGVELFVVSDHDVTPKAEEGGVPFEKLAFSEHALMVPGIEISCETQVSDVHIVGVGCDFSAPQFAKLQQDMQASKMAGYRILVDRLKEDGLDISWQKVLHSPDGAPITESALQRKHIFEAVARRGGAATWADAKVMVQTSPRYSDIKREKISPGDAIGIIRQTGGVAILAHPYLIADSPFPGVSRGDYIQGLIEAGLFGIEGAYPYSKTTYRGNLSDDQIEKQVCSAYEGRLFISGGSDYHGGDDSRKMGEAGVSRQAIRAFAPLENIIESWRGKCAAAS